MRLRVGFIGLMIALLGLTSSFRTSTPVQATLGNPTVLESVQASAPQGTVRIREQESNNTIATANPIIASSTIIRGNIWPYDRDVYSIQLATGDRLAVASMLDASAVMFPDTAFTLYAPDGTTIIEVDDDNGSLNPSASVISSAPLTQTGTYYLQIDAYMSSQARYYDLYVRVLSEAATAEQEPNNSNAMAQSLPSSGIITGMVSSITDRDVFQLNLNAGDTIFTSLDLDPERDNTAWNGKLGIGLFNNFSLEVDDPSSTSPNAEAHFMTVKHSGTYYVQVSTAATSIPAPATYLLGVTIFPAQQQTNCTTYVSSDDPKIIPTTTSFISSTLTVPDNFIIADLNLTIQLTHTEMNDLDVQLQGPDGNVGGLFRDVGGAVQPIMNLDLDDEAALRIGIYGAMNGIGFIPEPDYRLGWFDGGRSAGTWTLLIHDDSDQDGGILQNWSIRLCAAPQVTCPLTTIASFDFEANDGGFTHSGTRDTWEYGAPSAAPLIGSYSGTNSWKTNLDGVYSINSTADLLSPSISIPNLAGPIYLQWQQRYQMEDASYDHYNASISTGVVTKTLYEFDAGTMINRVGNPEEIFHESTVWSRQLHDISEFKGQSVQVRYHLDTDNSLNLGGIAIDDFQIIGCTSVLTATPTATNTPTNTPTATPTNTVTPSATVDPIRSLVYLPFVGKNE